jgi:hypothetical protein
VATAKLSPEEFFGNLDGETQQVKLLPELLLIELRSTGVLHAKVILQPDTLLANVAPQLNVKFSPVQVEVFDPFAPVLVVV